MNGTGQLTRPKDSDLPTFRSVRERFTRSSEESLAAGYPVEAETKTRLDRGDPISDVLSWLSERFQGKQVVAVLSQSEYDDFDIYWAALYLKWWAANKGTTSDQTATTKLQTAVLEALPNMFPGPVETWGHG